MNQDKKKLIVVGVLALAIVAIGAFQLMPSSSPAPAPTASKTSEKSSGEANGTENPTNVATNSTSAEYAADATDASGEAVAADGSKVENDPMRQLYSISLAVRDPFDALTAFPAADSAVKPTPVPPTPAPRASRNGGWNDPGLGMPPFDPLKGTLPDIGGPGAGQPPMNIVPQGPAYSASGVIRGDKNAAVIADAQGNQRLVYEGQAIDGDARVVSVQKGKVVIRKKDGKSITLSVGGNP